MTWHLKKKKKTKDGNDRQQSTRPKNEQKDSMKQTKEANGEGDLQQAMNGNDSKEKTRNRYVQLPERMEDGKLSCAKNAKSTRVEVEDKNNHVANTYVHSSDSLQTMKEQMQVYAHHDNSENGKMIYDNNGSTNNNTMKVIIIIIIT
ncbi:hypothetical protein RFI_21133, partial [Reticulomyxa filosa]